MATQMGIPIPEGSARSDHKVTLDTYVYPGGPESVFKLYQVGKNHHLHELSEAAEVITGSPENPPVYAVYAFNGITEFVEHRDNEPIFYMCDDPAIWEKPGLSY